MLEILNTADIEEELRTLGLYDNPHYFINTEFAEEGTSNATAYDGNYIFLHGVNAFYEASHRGMVRPGLKKPLTYNPKKDSFEYFFIDVVLFQIQFCMPNLQGLHFLFAFELIF